MKFLFSNMSLYVFKQIMWCIVLVLLVVLSLDALSRVIEQTNDMQADYTFVQLLLYIALTLPGRLVEYIPYASLIGCLAGMGMLTNNSELVVMRAAGISIWRLVLMALFPVALIMLASMVVAEFVAPKLDQYAEQQRLEQRYSKKRLFAKQEFWNREQREFIRINRLTYDGNVSELSRYVFNDDWRLIKSQYAESAVYEEGGWILKGAVETNFEINPETSKVVRLHSTEDANSVWRTTLDSFQLRYLIADPDELNVFKLKTFIGYLKSQNLNTEHYQLAFWEKLFYPLTAIGLILIAIPGVFGSTRQVSIGYRVFVGVLIGVLFRMLQNLLTPAALVYDLSPVLISFLPIALCVIIGFHRLNRVH
ncbi:MAG: LPS export ABC transporter permease LptG [Pseudomonadota bacterium]